MSLSYAALGRPAPSINASRFRCPCQSCGHKVLKLQYSRNRREYYLKHWSNFHLVFWHHFGPGVVPQDPRRWLHPAAPVLPAVLSIHPLPLPQDQILAPAPVSRRKCALSHCLTTRVAAKCDQHMCLTHCAERGGCSIHTATLRLSPPLPLHPDQLATLSGYRTWTTTTPQALESAELARLHAHEEQEAWMASLFPLPPSSPPQPTSPIRCSSPLLSRHRSLSRTAPIPSTSSVRHTGRLLPLSPPRPSRSRTSPSPAQRNFAIIDIDDSSEDERMPAGRKRLALKHEPLTPLGVIEIADSSDDERAAAGGKPSVLKRKPNASRLPKRPRLFVSIPAHTCSDSTASTLSTPALTSASATSEFPPIIDLVCRRRF